MPHQLVRGRWIVIAAEPEKPSTHRSGRRQPLVFRSIRDDVPDTALWVFHVSFVAREEDDVQMVDAPSRRPAIVVANGVGIGAVAQEGEFQHGFDVILRPLSQLFAVQHLPVQVVHIDGFDDLPDPVYGVEVVRLIGFVELEQGAHVTPRNDECMSRIDWVGVEKAEHPSRRRDSARQDISGWLSLASGSA